MWSVVEIDTDEFPRLEHARSHCFDLLDAVGFVFAIQVDVSACLDFFLCVDDNDGNGVVFVDDFQHEVEVGVVVCHIQRAHGFCPNLHFVVLFFSQFFHQWVWHDKWDHSYGYSCNHEDDLDLTYSISPLHRCINNVFHYGLLPFLAKGWQNWTCFPYKAIIFSVLWLLYEK